MVDSPTKIYKDYVRANLPNGMSYDTGTNRYDINNHSFFSYNNSNWYYQYISKYGYSALSAYAANGFDPALVFDFKGNYFRKSATDSTFAASITHAASTNATMVDSDGLLKWRPHNILKYSEDLTNANWVKQVSATVDANVSAAPDGSMTASRLTFGGSFSNLRQFGAAVTGVTATTKVWIKLESGNANLAFGISSSQFDVITVTSDWVEYSTTDTENAANGKGFILQDRNSSGFGSVLIWQPQSFRSDLGGMVNNPDAPTGYESYVPTTSLPVYLSRRGHHSYNGSSWVNEGVLHESEARTNLQVHSGDFSNSAWSKSVLTVDTSYVAPDGTSTASKFTSTGTAGASGVYDSNPKGTGMSLTCFMKAGSSGVYGWIEGIVGGTSPYAVFDLESGTVVRSRECDASIEPVGNGWFRCVLANTTNAISFFSVGGSDNTYTSSPWGSSSLTQGKFIYAWGAQLEAGSTPSSYIPTGSATATRAAETLTVPAASLPYDNTNMSIQMDGKMTYADSGISSEVEYYRWLLDGTNYINSTIQADSLRTGELVFAQRQSTTIRHEALSLGNAYSPDTNVPFNFAVRHGSTFINGAHEGTLLTANTTPTALPDLSSTDLTLGFDFMGTIGQFRMWSEDLTDAGIAEAST